MNFGKSLLICALLALRLPAWADVTVTDICVYGANSGGITAAIQATRQGKSVVLLAASTQIGGMMTGGLSSVDYGNTASIGGISQEFFLRVAARYGATSFVSTFEPHVALQEFLAMLAAASVPIRYNQQIVSVTKTGAKITEIAMADGSIYRAKVFIDATYESDLLVLAGVSSTVGRESASTYNESLAGIGTTLTQAQFNAPVDPYVIPGVPQSGLIAGIQAGDGGVTGAGDNKLPAYNYRLCLSNNASNRLAIQAPDGYLESTYEIFARHIAARIAAGTSTQLTDILQFVYLPNQKADVNNGGAISTDFIGGNYDYPNSTPAQRAQIAANHRTYIQGLLYYLGNSSRVPTSIRNQMLAWGLAKDEFINNGGWPDQLYIRECRRLVSDYVMLQDNGAGKRIAPDSIGLGSYTMDSHLVQRFVKNGLAYNEGTFLGGVPSPYPISLHSILPRQSECENLIVSWSVSASHVAFSSIRMEPVFMILGQSAATTAAFAIDANVPVQQIPYSKISAELRADKQLLGTSNTNTPDIIMDDADATGVTISGTWGVSTAITGYYGSGYRQNGAVGDLNKTFRFTPTIPASGYYNVQMRWTSSSNRASSVPIDVIHEGGTYTTTINEQTGGGTWNTINGTAPLYFNAGTDSSILIRTAGVTGYVIADAVRLVSALPSLQIVASDSIAREIDPADTARFTIVRDSTQTTNAWTVNYLVSGTATPGSDYLPLSGSVVIPAGQATASIVVTAIPDDLFEGPESVIVSLLPTADYGLGDNSVASIQILDKPVVQIATTVESVREDQPTNAATLTVSRDALDTSSAWVVNYTLSGTATPDVDYVSPSGSVVIPVGATSTTISISPLPDLLSEGDETVTVNLLPGNGFIVGPQSSATVRIMDVPPVTIATTSRIAREQDPTDVGVFTVSRDTSQTATDWTVNYLVSGTATPGSDYVALTGTVVIPAGSASATITVTAIPDDLPEGIETVVVTLLPGGSYCVGSPATATVKILDKPIDEWRASVFTNQQLADPSISGDNADPDGDSFSNLTEYVLGLNPLVADSSATVTGWDTDGHLTMTYRQRRSATDVTVIAEGSTDLSSWSSDPLMIQEVSRLRQGYFDLVTVRLVPLNPVSGFLRIRVTRP